MLPKSIRDMRRRAKENLKAAKRVFKQMEIRLDTENIENICVAAAYLRILEYHMIEGDMQPHNVSLATLLRGDGKDLIEVKND